MIRTPFLAGGVQENLHSVSRKKGSEYMDVPLKRGGSTLRNYGYDRDHSGCPQVVPGLIMTQDGVPICHHVFARETADKSTFGSGTGPPVEQPSTVAQKSRIALGFDSRK